MKVCCENGKCVSEMGEAERLSCNHDHCLGPIEEYLYKAFSGETEESKLSWLNSTEENT